jgi:ssDNA-binding Zn-finger/Zn-ribbon topoisomerase 1
MEETTTAQQHTCPVCGSPMILRIISFPDWYQKEGAGTTSVIRREKYWECVNIKCGHKVGE